VTAVAVCATVLLVAVTITGAICCYTVSNRRCVTVSWVIIIVVIVSQETVVSWPNSGALCRIQLELQRRTITTPARAISPGDRQTNRQHQLKGAFHYVDCGLY